MNIDYIKEKVKNSEDILLIDEAYYFVNCKLNMLKVDNESIMDHILEVTKTLADFNADTLTLVSSLVYVSVYVGVSYEEIEKEFGDSVANIAFSIAGINKNELCGNYKSDESCLNQLYALKNDDPDDHRIFFIKLAFRFYTMKVMANYPKEVKDAIVKDTLNVLVPIASKFRLNYIKGRLEDLCLLYLKPNEYYDILSKLGGDPTKLRKYLNGVVEEVSFLLNEQNVLFRTSSRVKSIFSIYQKLSRGKKWEDIYDILALTIIVDTVADCYKVFDLVHSNFIPVGGRVKDYILNPKDSAYQALHTTIIDNNGRFIEIQIKTHDMNERDILGHVAYKKSRQKCII